MVVALGIDFEDITHTPAYRSLDDPGDTSVDLHRNTNVLLELFDRHDVSATFFVVADIADTHQGLVERIAAAGHEIASHTVSHCSLTKAKADTVVDELRHSKAILENQTGTNVEGFRAPTCQIDHGVYRALVEEGYEYSSSVMPPLPIPGFYSNEYTFFELTSVTTQRGELIEVPLSVHPLVRFPLSGAWMRLLGRRYTLQGMRSALHTGRNIVTYSHPWEFESLWDSPLPFRNRVRTGSWLTETYEGILELDAEFCTVGELIERTPPTQTYLVS